MLVFGFKFAVFTIKDCLIKTRRRGLVIFLLIFLSVLRISTFSNASIVFDHQIFASENSYKKDTIYNEALELGLKGFEHLNKEHSLSNYLVVVDFSKPSFEERLYVFDMQRKVIVHESYVAHGKNSGLVYAKHFSNIRNSNTSSLGFFKTAETYYGKHGLSLKLDGLEVGINDKARERAIVIHSAEYVSNNFIKRYGRLGRSFGCPALPEKGYNHVIEMIKEGALLFIYHPDEFYKENSNILKEITNEYSFHPDLVIRYE